MLIVSAAGYHPYTDPDGFCYSVLLVRTFLLENRLEKLTLKVRYPLQTSGRWPLISSHPCPLPIYMFPASAGLSSHPVVRYQDRFPSTPRLRVPVPRPWAQCLQLFESDVIPHAYACYVKYSRKGRSGLETLAIPGSSWEVAFDSFRKFFKTKTRKDWKDRLDGKPAPIGNDGNSDDPFRYEPPKAAHEPKGLVEQKTRLERTKESQSGGNDSVTMMVTTVEISDDDDEGIHRKVQACTPPGMGW
jgi:WGR domain